MENSPIDPAIIASNLASINQVVSRLQSLARIPFSWDNDEHFDLIDSFYTLSLPNTPRSCARGPCVEWNDVGFQGADPGTDFRAMGLLALTHLQHFAERHTKDARKVLKDSFHPKR